MATQPISFPQWYEDGERASDGEIERLVERIEHFEDWDDIDERTDWRWCVIPRPALEPMLYADAEAFIFEHIKDEDEDCAQDRATFAKVVEAMKETGAAQHFEQEPGVILISRARGEIGVEALSDEYPIGAAFHEFGAESIRALVAIKGANRFLPRERAEPWSDDPGWSAHALDGDGPRFEEDLCVRGGACKAVFLEIAGDINGTCTAAQVDAFSRDAREWSGSGRDAWLDQEPEFPAVRDPKRVAALDAAADEVIAFLERCAEIDLGLVAGKGAAKFKPGRAR